MRRLMFAVAATMLACAGNPAREVVIPKELPPAAEETPRTWCQALSLLTDAERLHVIDAVQAEGREDMKRGGYIINENTEHCWIEFEKQMDRDLAQHCFGTPDDAAIAFKGYIAMQRAEECYQNALKGIK